MEKLYAGDNFLYVSQSHKFGSDAVALAEFARTRVRGKTAVDLCTGCGIIAVLLAQYGAKSVTALDIAADALALLSQTVAETPALSRIVPVCGDLRDKTALGNEFADVVTVNPPYYKAGSGYEPDDKARRVARHEVDCELNDVCAAAARVLKYGGVMYMCLPPARLTDMMCGMRGCGIEPKALRLLRHKGKSEPWLCLCEGKKGGRSGVRVETD